MYGFFDFFFFLSPRPNNNFLAVTVLCSIGPSLHSSMWEFGRNLQVCNRMHKQKGLSSWTSRTAPAFVMEVNSDLL